MSRLQELRDEEMALRRRLSEVRVAIRDIQLAAVPVKVGDLVIVDADRWDGKTHKRTVLKMRFRISRVRPSGVGQCGIQIWGLQQKNDGSFSGVEREIWRKWVKDEGGAS